MALVLVVLFVLALIPAKLAADKGRSFFGWWAFGVAAFVVALPASMLVSPTAGAMRVPCGSCGESISASASVCRYCDRPVSPVDFTVDECPRCGMRVAVAAKRHHRCLTASGRG